MIKKKKSRPRSMVYDALKEGKENALDAKFLCKLLGVKNERSLQSIIHRERRQGNMICSTHDADVKGYYKPATRQELAEYVRMMENSANSMKKAIRPAKKRLKEWEGNEESPSENEE